MVPMYKVYERHGAWMYLRINMDNGPLFPSPAMEDRTQNPKPKCQPHPSKYQIPEPQDPFSPWINSLLGKQACAYRQTLRHPRTIHQLIKPLANLSFGPHATFFELATRVPAPAPVSNTPCDTCLCTCYFNAHAFMAKLGRPCAIPNLTTSLCIRKHARLEP